MLEAPTKPKATLASVEAHLASGNLAAAVVAIRQVHQTQPTPESLALYRRVLDYQACQSIDHKNQAEFDRILNVAEALEPKDQDWAFTRATWLAKWGRLPQALMTLSAEADEVSRQKLVAHAADRAIRFKSYTGLPEEHHEGCKTIVLAFAKYERGDDDAARELLQNVGLQSPFLEWKLMLRGLMAYAASDDAKALDNWQRLAKERLPARLIWPLRARLDEAFRNSHTPTVVGVWNEQARELSGSKTQSLVMELQKTIGQPAPLGPAWPTIEAAWAALKPQHPELADRLGHCVYHAIVRQGHPNDLSRYKRIFGTPTDDPDFHRLQAMVLESQEQIVPAISFWGKYERWLGTKPASWNETILKRARCYCSNISAGSARMHNGPNNWRRIYARQSSRSLEFRTRR